MTCRSLAMQVPLCGDFVRGQANMLVCSTVDNPISLYSAHKQITYPRTPGGGRMLPRGLGLYLRTRTSSVGEDLRPAREIHV